MLGSMRETMRALVWLLGSPIVAVACAVGSPEEAEQAAPEDDVEFRGAGKCSPRCLPGKACCGSFCSDLQSDTSNCGACGRSCGSFSSCVDGECKCNVEGEVKCPWNNLGVESTTCTDLNEDLNCGECGKLCLWGNCNNGNCTCPANRSTCAQDGGIACVNTATNFRHCGGCGQRCAGDWCAGGTCGCDEPKTACTFPTAEGTITYCADMLTDPNNCGFCGTVCETGACANGVCVACPDTSCWTPNGMKCVKTDTDAANCGVCGLKCPPGASCEQGACSCDGLNPDMCSDDEGFFCTDKARDANNCGICRKMCVAGAPCEGGVCACPNPGTTRENCNCSECAGNKVCSETVWGPLCMACQNWTTPCGNLCKDLQVDRANCGACGTACAENAKCYEGKCVDCPAGQTRCVNGCFDLQNDRLACGECFNLCPPDKVCQAGVCVAGGGSSSGDWGGSSGWGDASGEAEGDASGEAGDESGGPGGSGTGVATLQSLEF